jgi:hypothetical protein
VGKERVGLEDHAQVPLAGLQLVDDLAVDADLPSGRLLEPCDHPERGGLAAPRGADQHDELALRDDEIQTLHSLDACPVDLAQPPQLDAGHAD